jgi:hypothetical protein
MQKEKMEVVGRGENYDEDLRKMTMTPSEWAEKMASTIMCSPSDVSACGIRDRVLEDEEFSCDDFRLLDLEFNPWRWRCEGGSGMRALR